MTRESSLSFGKYINHVRKECKTINHWPLVDGNSTLNVLDGYCPFDLTPGSISEVLGRYPLWAQTFKEKGLKPDNKSSIKIPLNWEEYNDLEVFTNVRDEKFCEWDTDTKLGDFLGVDGCSFHIEREIINLGENFPKVLVERLVAITEEDQSDVWGLGIIREPAYFEVSDEVNLVIHLFGVEPYTEYEYGVEQNWCREWHFLKPIDNELLNYPTPLSIFNPDLVGDITRRSLIPC